MTLTIIVILALFLILMGILEYSNHIRNVKSIPIRIHVNGTRGKSSVTRLVAAGLRESGMKVFAKTTGTLPRVITDKGNEFPVYRPFNANIIEQLRIFSFAARNRAEAIVIECMALQPTYQSLTELNIVKATHGIITNARADHLDVMGPSERDVALSLLGTTPKNAKLYTCEKDYVEEFEYACKDRDCELFIISDDEKSDIKDEEMNKFSYIEHKENVALALKVCSNLDIPRDVALRGMQKVKPDVGAMYEYSVNFFGRKIIFINGFAANDPESSEKIWSIALSKHKDIKRKIMLLNMRGDRPDRSQQLGEVLKDWAPAYKYVVIGSGGDVLIKTAIKSGLDASLFINAEGYGVDKIFEIIVDVSGKNSVVMGIGNIKGVGLDLVKYFKNRSNIDDIMED